MNDRPPQFTVFRDGPTWTVEAINRDHDDGYETASFTSRDAEGQALRFAEREYGYKPGPGDIRDVLPEPTPTEGPSCLPPENTVHELHWVRRGDEWDVWHWDHTQGRWWTWGLRISTAHAGGAGWIYHGPAIPPGKPGVVG